MVITGDGDDVSLIVELGRCSVEAAPERWPAHPAPPSATGADSPTDALNSVCWFDIVAAGGSHTTFGAPSQVEAFRWVAAILRIARGGVQAVDYLYQHERRWGPAAPFGAQYLLPGERQWADFRGAEMDAGTYGLPPALAETAAAAAEQALLDGGWAQSVAAGATTDNEGWAYASNWHATWLPFPIGDNVQAPSSTNAASREVSMVRRRAWVRRARPGLQAEGTDDDQIQLMAQLESAAVRLSSGYGCEVGVIVFDDRGRLAQQLAPASADNKLGPVLQRFRCAFECCDPATRNSWPLPDECTLW